MESSSVVLPSDAQPARSAVTGHEWKTIASLDGWRAVAILVVFLSHAGLGHLIPGGFGVTVFFFLSGYLITSLMITEFGRSGTLSISNFYIRRLLRLAPPLLVTLIVAYSLTYFGVLKGGVSWKGLGAQIFYLANYYQLFFDHGGTTPEGTGIFWSLAVEEHFYIVFPWIFVALYRARANARFLTLLVVTCVVVFCWRYYLATALGASEDRIYYASDTRIDSIIFGSLLALLRNPLAARDEPSRRWEWGLLFAASVSILFTFVYRSEIFRDTGRYTVQGIALAPLFYYSIRLPRSGLFRVLNLRVMRYIGRHSYSIYLIHFVLISNLANLTSHGLLNMSFCFLLAIVYAELVDRLIDQRFRRIRARFR